MAFGSRGSGQAKATYYPATKVINITKVNGKGSVAHEWGHFLDHMITHIGDPAAGRKWDASGTVMQPGDSPFSPEITFRLRTVMDAIMYDRGDPEAAKKENASNH